MHMYITIQPSSQVVHGGCGTGPSSVAPDDLLEVLDEFGSIIDMLSQKAKLNQVQHSHWKGLRREH